MPPSPGYRPDPRYLSLGEGFADAVVPARFPQRVLRFRNQRWAAEIGLGELTDEEWRRAFWSFEPLPDNLPVALATRYHGHQFRQYNPDLGDGRGFLFAQLRDGAGRLLDLGTKGSGRTPYSRGGDGRLTLKGGVRELLATEMLEALGVPTSKTFSIFETGERLQRSDEPSPTRACVLVRLSHSHLRFGTFQRHAYHGDRARLRRLVEHCAEVYFPDLDEKDRPHALFVAAAARTAELAGRWMASGFVHGVLNTDNMNITGESFDYGPWRFLPRYDPSFTAAYFDSAGLYAYGRQMEAARWNLERLAEALAPLSPEAPWHSALEGFAGAAHAALGAAVLERLGLLSAGADQDEATVAALWSYLREVDLPFAQIFHDWFGGEASVDRARQSPFARHYARPAFAKLRRALARHEPREPERLSHPYFARPRPVDLLVGEVEELWARIDLYDDWRPLRWKVRDIRAMGAALGRASDPQRTRWPEA